MGGKDGSLTLHKIELTVKDIVMISKGLAIDNNIKETKIVVDCNNVVYHYLSSSSVTGSVAKLLCQLANLRFVVVPVIDGKRPICKQATNQRIANKEKNRIKAHKIRLNIRQSKHRVSIWFF